MASLTVNSGVSPFAPSSVGGTSTSEQMFPAPSANFTSSTLSTTTPMQLTIPNSGQYEQQRIVVNASGKVTLGSTSSPTLLWKMYSGKSLTASSNGTAVLTMSALTGLTVSKTYPWTWQSIFQGDSTSGILQAISSTLWVDNATAGTITLTGIASGVNFGGGVGIITSGYSSNYALNFVLSFTFGVSSATNICYCSQFVAES